MTTYPIYRPVQYLFQGTQYQIPIESFFTTIAFVFFIYWVIKGFQKERIFLKPKQLFWFFFAAIFGSLAGGRMWYYIEHWKGLKTFIDIFDLSSPGLVSYGMVIGGTLSILLFTYLKGRAENRKNLFPRYIDLVAPAAALFVFIYRMGCYHFGDVIGTPTNLPWGVFAIQYGKYNGIIMHPTALYLSFSALLIFLFLNWYKERKYADGEIGLLFLALYSFNRFWIEFLRNDVRPYLGLSFSQWVLVITFLVSVYILYRQIWFFRDPVREVPKDAKIIAPADGKIIYIKEVKDGEVPMSIKHRSRIFLDDILKAEMKHKQGVLIGIYLSLVDVHYQRTPIDGEVKDVWYHDPGFNYSFWKMFIRNIFGLKPVYKNSRHILQNERNIIHIKGTKHDCFVVQIADKVVNKIECYVRVGDKVEIGQKIGLIRMGSQVDLFIPNIKKEQVKLKVGKIVRAGLSRVL